MDLPYKIFHLSDVHFGAHFDQSLWEYVRALLVRERPNLILCTGDVVDHGGIFMLALARRSLEELRDRAGAGAELRVVPGNHDRGPWGNINCWPFSKNFEVMFSEDAIELDGVPTYETWRSRGFWHRTATRVCLTARLSMRRLKWSMTPGKRRHLTLTRSEDPAEVSLIYLDSNDQMWLASGKVDVRELMRLQAEILIKRDQTPNKAFVPRIALMHHHPLPIPHASIQEGLTSFEPFLVLRNAGTVLRELNRCDVDLILHGHKHYSSFGRLGYATDDHAEGEIAVLAAGSSGVTVGEAGRNSVNFIDVFPNGQLSYTTIAFGGGRGEPVTELFRDSRPIHSIEMHKARAFRRALEHHGQHAKELVREVDLDDGVGHVSVCVNGLQIDRTLSTTIRPARIQVSMGGVHPASIQLDARSRSQGYSICNVPMAPSRLINFGINLNQPLAAATRELTYGYNYVEFNSYATSAWEAAEAAKLDGATQYGRLRAEGLEYVSIVVRLPAHRLRLRVSFEDSEEMAGYYAVQPVVRVMRWSTYPKVALNDAREFQESDGNWILDAALSKHEQSRLRMTSDGHWELCVDFPLVGHRYDITWSVRDLDPIRPSVMRTALAARTRLLRDHDARGSGSQNSCVAIHETLSEELVPLWYQEFHSTVDTQEIFAVAMFVYDDEKHCLREVCEVRAGAANTRVQSSKYLELPLSEGVAGAAFKRGTTVTYVAPGLDANGHGGSYLYDERRDDSPGKWQVLVAIPVYVTTPFSGAGFTEGQPPQQAVGVLTIASTAVDSKLLQFSNEQSEALAELKVKARVEQNVAPIGLQGEQTNEPNVDAGANLSARTDEKSTQVKPKSAVTLSTLWACAYTLICTCCGVSVVE